MCFEKKTSGQVCFGFEQSLLIVFLLRFDIVQVTLRRWMVDVLEFGHQVSVKFHFMDRSRVVIHRSVFRITFTSFCLRF